MNVAVTTTSFDQSGFSLLLVLALQYNVVVDLSQRTQGKNIQ